MSTEDKRVQRWWYTSCERCIKRLSWAWIHCDASPANSVHVAYTAKTCKSLSIIVLWKTPRHLNNFSSQSFSRRSCGYTPQINGLCCAVCRSFCFPWTAELVDATSWQMAAFYLLSSGWTWGFRLAGGLNDGERVKRVLIKETGDEALDGWPGGKASPTLTTSLLLNDTFFWYMA